MKKLRILLIIIATILLFNSCEKDENGYRITYYKNKTAVGYVYSVETHTPISNFKMHSCASVSAGIWSCKHINYCITDESGKFTFELVKSIDGLKTTRWGFGSGSSVIYSGACYDNFKIFPPDFLDTKEKTLYLDTIFECVDIPYETNK